MRIADLPLGDIEVRGDDCRIISGVTNDSRVCEPTDLYVALPGANVHGAKFVPQLVDRGVRAVLTDPRGVTMLTQAGLDVSELSLLVHPFPRGVMGGIAAAVYGTTPDKPTLFGVTGTNGKTTTTFMLDAYLRALGHTTGLIGTVATVIAGRIHTSVRTTPEAPALHQLYATMRAAGVDTCLMEVSSHALAQHRVDGSMFAVTGFTNLTQDHLDYHGTMEHYFAAKARLFTPEFARRGVVVLTDNWARKLAAEAPIPVRTVSRNPADNPDYLVEFSTNWQLTTPTGTLGFTPLLPGDFNVMNTALALAMLIEGGTDQAELAAVAHTTSVKVPGRMEVVHATHPRAIVDYSHTPDAIEKVLAGLDGDPLIIVVGAGGDRDATKRPAMGLAAARGADIVIVTDDNPRTEDPATIRQAVLAGAKAHPARARRIEEVADRAHAIRLAAQLAGTTGTIVVAGKGHETGQEIAGVIHPFDDRVQTRDAIAGAANDKLPGKVQE